MSSLLIVSHEPLEERMSGPSIRSWELAHTVASRHDVTLAVPGIPGRSSDSVRVRGYDAASLPVLVSEHDVVQVGGYLLDRFPSLREARHLVVDLYDPFPLENLHMHKAAPLPDQHRIAGQDRAVLTRLLQAGDLFLCASERQRDFWTGWLAAAGRVNPYVHERDPALGGLLRLVPFGLSEEPPRPGPPRFRGVVPGLAADDFLVLWGGGIWNWFDPLTLIRAAAALRDRLPGLRVLFPAVASPSTEVPAMAMASEARRLAEELGLIDSAVFFGSGWVPYGERGSMLLEADVGVSLHREDVETRYSFRTRILDYLWAGLPVLTTTGDSMADLVRTADLGAVVPYGDVEAVAGAVLRLAEDPERRRACAGRSRSAAAHLTWPAVARPLIEYCDEPRGAPDRGRPMPAWSWPQADQRGDRPPGLWARAISTYRERGGRGVLEKVVRRLAGGPG